MFTKIYYLLQTLKCQLAPDEHQPTISAQHDHCERSRLGSPYVVVNPWQESPVVQADAEAKAEVVVSTYLHKNKERKTVVRHFLPGPYSNNQAGKLEHSIETEEERAEASFLKEFDRAQKAMDGQKQQVTRTKRLMERYCRQKKRVPLNKYTFDKPMDSMELLDSDGTHEKIKPHPLNSFIGGHCEAKGRRNAQEDAHYSGHIEVLIAGQKKKMNIAAVFDGHGGAKASKYAAENLPRVMKNLWERFCKDGVTAAGSKNAQKLTTVTLDDEVYEKGIRDGSTANILAMLDNTLYASNLGDSRSLMVGPDGAVTALSRDMKIIEDRSSINNRKLKLTDRQGLRHKRSLVNVARTIGDYRGSKVGPSARPKLVRIQKDDWKGHYGIIVCDGISDVMTTAEIGEKVHASIQKGWTEEQIALGLVAYANTTLCSCDNLSALVINLESMAKNHGGDHDAN